MLAEGGHIFGRRPKPRALAETGNRARKDSGTQGNFGHKKRATEICDIFPSIPNDFWENDGR